MPSSEEMHFPLTRKKKVFEIFVSEFYAMYGTDLAPPAMACFLHIWNHQCRRIKVSKSSRFSLSTACDQFGLSLALCALTKADTIAALLKRSAQIEMFAKNVALKISGNLMP